MITKIKQSIMTSALKKRVKNSVFDDVASESFRLPKEADTSQNNSYYFTAHSDSGESFFLRLGERGGGLNEVWFAYRSADGSAYINTQPECHEGCPITLTCVEPLKEWRVQFDGHMYPAASEDGFIYRPSGQELKAKFDATFVCTEPLYNFSRDASPVPLARAIAAMKWNKQFFEEIKQNDQIHTEQGGTLKGSLEVGGKSYRIDAPALRDHSFGKRDWDYMNRHIWLIMVNQKQCFNISNVEYPALSGLRMGYNTSNGRTDNVIDTTPIQDMPTVASLPNSMRSGFKLGCILNSGRVCDIECKPEIAFEFLMGGRYKIYEGIASYSIDGTKARGISEFGFNIKYTKENQ